MRFLVDQPLEKEARINYNLSVVGLLVLIIVAVFGIFGCQPNHFFEDTARIPPSGWIQSNLLDFTFEIDDTMARYDLSLLVEHAQTYTYQNLYLKFTTVFPDRNAIEKVVSVDLADPQGRWYGDCRGSSCRAEVSLQKNAFFQAMGTHHVTVAQHMRMDTLNDISAVTLNLQKSGVSN